MRHAHDGRAANLLGALSVAIADRMRLATEEGAGHGGSAPAALISLAGYLDGGPIDSLRDPLRLTHSAAVRVVDRLVSAGLARRRRGRDRRSVAVELTPTGRGAAAGALEARRGVLEAALGSCRPRSRPSWRACTARCSPDSPRATPAPRTSAACATSTPADIPRDAVRSRTRRQRRRPPRDPAQRVRLSREMKMLTMETKIPVASQTTSSSVAWRRR